VNRLGAVSAFVRVLSESADAVDVKRAARVVQRREEQRHIHGVEIRRLHEMLWSSVRKYRALAFGSVQKLPPRGDNARAGAEGGHPCARDRAYKTTTPT